VNLKQANRFVALIREVEEFPTKNWSKSYFRDGNKRCAGGILCDTSPDWTWNDSNAPRCKKKLPLLVLDSPTPGTRQSSICYGSFLAYLGLAFCDAELFNSTRMSKRVWLRKAFAILAREGYEVE
jgi:hypothetical protein